MSWDKVDLFELERDFFTSEIREVILPLFDTAWESFSQWQKRINEEFEKERAGAKNDAEATDAQGTAAWNLTRVDEQATVMGSAALGYLCTALKTSLNDIARYFDATHPKSKLPYGGKDWLSRLQAEFKERFGLDFEQCPIPFERIRELVLARNAGTHWDGDALDEYREKIRTPRFIEDGLLFAVPRDRLLEAVTDAEGFVGWVVTELGKLRKAGAAEG